MTPRGHPFTYVIISCRVAYENTSTNFTSLTNPRSISFQLVADLSRSLEVGYKFSCDWLKYEQFSVDYFSDLDFLFECKNYE